MNTTSKIYDAIVVGSGASGSFAVKELTERGLYVLLLEAGEAIDPEKDFPVPCEDAPVANTKDRMLAALRGQYVQARCTSFSPKTARLFVNDRKNPYTSSRRSPYLWFRSRKLGGRLHLWGRAGIRWSDLYFKAADHDGCGENWPVSYFDMEPFYAEVEKFLGVDGTQDGIPHIPDSCYAGPKDLTPGEQRFRNTVLDGWPDRYVVPARTVRHNPQRIPLPILAAQKTGRLTIQPNAIAKKIAVDSQTGKANGVIYIDAASNQEVVARSEIVVLCASAIESVRILLNSASPKHPAGLSNSSGTLGHYFMDHNALIFFGNTSDAEAEENTAEGEKDPWDLAYQSGFYIPRFRNVNEKSADFTRGYAIHGGIDRSPNFWWMLAYGQMLPHFENRVQLHRRKKDAWGIPVAHIECLRSSNDLVMAQDAKDSVEQMLKAANLTCLEDSAKFRRWAKSSPLQAFVLKALQRKVFTVPPHLLFLGGAIHEMGGARMGEDPKKSVLNQFNQCWDAKNVLVTDGACFPSSGEHHTLTMMALTVRACRHIADLYNQSLL